MVRPIERLSDWFDALVRLKLPGGSAEDLHDASPPGALRPIDAEIASPADLASLREALCAQGVRRPLLLTSGDDRGLRAAWPTPFMVRLDDGSDEADLALRPDRRTDLEAEATAAVRRLLAEPKALNILVLYCDDFSHIETIHEHLRSFSLYSRYTIFYLPASDPEGRPTLENLAGADWPDSWDLSFFDVIVWHYVVPAYLKERLSPLVTRQLAAFDGLKVLFVQDEYDSTATTSAWMRRAGVDLMFTCAPPDAWSYVYPPADSPGVEFFRTLTGYVPEDRGLEGFSRPMEARTLRIGYRGRVLPYRYGRLAREKAEIGVEMKRLAEARGVAVDIAVDEASRIYGQDWYRFLGSARATLATESGSNVFDLDGRLAELGALAEAAGDDFESFHARHLAEIDGRVRMNQVSPKIFEAIRLRTALICFEGEYSGVIRPGDHYIPLRKDYGNADEVFAALEDVEALEAMTRRAYDEVIGSGRYSYEAFVGEFDEILADRVLRQPRGEFISAPILRRRRGEPWRPVAKPNPLEEALNTGVLRRGLQRSDLADLIAQTREDELTLQRRHRAEPPADAREARAWGPDAMVCYEFWRGAGASVALSGQCAALVTPPIAWHYAAGVPLDLDGVGAALRHAWVRVRLRTVQGELRVGLYDGAADAFLDEQSVPAGDGEQTITLRATVPQASLLLFRTGPRDEAAGAVFLGAHLLFAAAYPPPVIEAARRIAREAPSLLEG